MVQSYEQHLHRVEEIINTDLIFALFSISRAMVSCSADRLFYSSAMPFPISLQTILTTKLASFLHLEMIYSFVSSVIPFIL